MQNSKRRYAALFNRLTHIIQELQEIQRESDEIFSAMHGIRNPQKAGGKLCAVKTIFAFTGHPVCAHWMK